MSSRLKFLSLTLGFLAMLLGGFLLWKEYSLSPETVYPEVSRQISDDLNQHIASLRGEMENATHPDSMGRELETVAWMWLDSAGHPKAWGQPALLPAPGQISEMGKAPREGLLNADDRTWFHLFARKQGELLSVYVPLRVHFPVRNQNFHDILFMGRYGSSIDPEAQLARIKYGNAESDLPISVRGPGDEVLYRIGAADLFYFHDTHRLEAILILLGGFLLVLIAFTFAVKRKASVFPLFAGFALLRLLLLFFPLPGFFSSKPLFSPGLLALNSWNASLAFFALNTLVVFLFIAWASPWLESRVLMLSRRLQQHNGVLLLTSLLSVLLSSLACILTGKLLAAVVLNSKIYSGFSNVFQVDRYSIILFLSFFGILASLFRLLRILGRFPVRYAEGDNRKTLLAFLLFMAIAFLSGYLFSGDVISALICIPGVMFPLALQRFAAQTRNLLRLDFPAFLVSVLWLSVMTAFGVIPGNTGKAILEMEAAAGRFAEERDLVTESLYERSLEKVRRIQGKFAAGEMPDSILKKIPDWIGQTYFNLPFEGYKVSIFAFDSTGSITQKSGSDGILIDPQAVRQGEIPGEPTFSSDLFWVSSPSPHVDYLYAGFVDLSSPSLGPMRLLVQLVPNQSSSGRLYPRLLLDEKMQDRFEIPTTYEYAAYREGKLHRKRGRESFPYQYEGPRDMQVGSAVIIRSFGNLLVYFHHAADEYVEVRFPGGGLMSLVSVFSFIFYLYVLVFLSILFPAFLFRRITRQSIRRALSLREKLQMIVFVTSVVPVIAMILFFSPFIRERFSIGVRNDLSRQAEQLSLLLKDFVYEACGTEGGFENTLTLEKKLQLTGDEHQVDLNLFDTQGRLMMTTQNAVYELGLAPFFMNNDAIRSMKSGSLSEFVSREYLGGLEYFSAYLPMRAPGGDLLAYLNLPLLSRQDEVNSEIRDLVSFLIDIYALVLLLTGILTLFLSNSIIRPLNLLRKRLEKTSLGRTNEPVTWESEDEIGEMIRSYNHMLSKLADSEQKLARSQRELAWKEMARQVAHEIKNPLTPMKLSIQHLSRAWKSGASNVEALFEKVTQTLMVQIDSLTHIANSFSEFARMPEPKKSVFSLNAVIREVVNLYEHTEGVQFFMDLPQEDFKVNWDRDQVSRVFNNLIKNALQAFESGSGTIHLRMKTAGGKAMIEVEDNGKGIPPEIREKIFQPNFSTKTSGMGLGLAMVRQVVEGAGGEIRFESEVAKGTTFFIEIPGSDIAS